MSAKEFSTIIEILSKFGAIGAIAFVLAVCLCYVVYMMIQDKKKKVRCTDTKCMESITQSVEEIREITNKNNKMLQLISLERIPKDERKRILDIINSD